jgi:hypothetical protein
VASHPETACGSQGCIASESLIAIGKMAVRLSRKAQGVKSRHLYTDINSSLANLATNRGGEVEFGYTRPGPLCVMTSLRITEAAVMTMENDDRIRFYVRPCQ